MTRPRRRTSRSAARPPTTRGPASRPGGDQLAVTQRGVCARGARRLRPAGRCGRGGDDQQHRRLPAVRGRDHRQPGHRRAVPVTIPFLGVRGVLGAAATEDGDRLRPPTAGARWPSPHRQPRLPRVRHVQLRRSPPRRQRPQAGRGGARREHTVDRGRHRLQGPGSPVRRWRPRTSRAWRRSARGPPELDPEEIKAAIVNTGNPAGMGRLTRDPRGAAAWCRRPRRSATNVVDAG